MPDATSTRRRLPIGAEVQPEGGVHFRVWAPLRKKVEVVLESPPGGHAPERPAAYPLAREPGDAGYFSARVAEAAASTRYRFRLDDAEAAFPDPASRFQPEGCHGPSEVIDPRNFQWHDDGWRGVALAGQIIYELHIGTFTPEGSWRAALEKLPQLVETGITLVEVMPVAEFPGRFGWGYDGVDLFAPTRLYGRPDDFRRFVDRAHALGLGVILDVVYNHFGPLGNYLGQYSRDYVTDRHHTDWGSGINFDDDNSAPVREFFVANAGYWIDEFHLDGLRLDAVQAIQDDSREHILAALTRRVREAAKERGTLVTAENEMQQSHLVRGAAARGDGLDAVWNDDFHHAGRVAATGHSEFYYGDYRGTPQELISAVKRGYLYQGQWNLRQKVYRGTAGLDLRAPQFVIFLQNHDQVANSAMGLRLHALTSPGRYRALTAVLLLAPGTPLLFQGQEFAASAPFFYFADHEPDLAELVRRGRLDFLKSFKSLAAGDVLRHLPAPHDLAAFERSKLDHTERETHWAEYALHCDLIRLRKEDPVFAAQRGDRVHGAVLGPEAFLLRYEGEEPGDDRLLLVNLGADLTYSPAPEPLLAPPAGQAWKVLWGSEDPRYGGGGLALLDPREWRLRGHAALVLTVATAEPEPQTSKK